MSCSLDLVGLSHQTQCEQRCCSDARVCVCSDKRRRTLTLSEAGTTLTTQITIVLRERLRLAYRSAGPDAVEGARKVMDALVR